MMLNAILRLLNSRCPACFKPVGSDPVRLGLCLNCSPDHRDRYLKGSDLTRGTIGRSEDAPGAVEQRRGEEKMEAKRCDRLLKLGLAGTILTCVACLTPAAVALLGLLGLARLAGYLDYVLFPLLAVFLGLLGYSYWQRQQGKSAGGA